MLRLTQACAGHEVEQARSLFKEYEVSLGISLCFQNFEKELAGLPGEYAPPSGRLLLAMENDQLAGCIALRRIDDDTCEMKRLYVRPEFQGRGFGRDLAVAIINDAHKIGYQRMRLDTLPSMKAAIALYRSLGFVEIEPYRANPVEGALYMELSLSPRTGPGTNTLTDASHNRMGACTR